MKNLWLSIILFSLSYSNFYCSEDADICLALNGNDLNYESTSDISGFQFEHNGCVTGNWGTGDATTAGFTISVSGSMVVGFSLSGDIIPDGTGTLIELLGSPSESCLTNFEFSGSDGFPLTWEFTVIPEDCAEGETLGCDGVCDSGYVDDECGICNGDNSSCSGCMDSAANNYNDDATIDDGSCTYDLDCLGVPGGTAEFDCTGTCNGFAIDDCTGVCDGSAVEDVCGVCGGGATDINTCINSLGIGNVTDTTLEIIMSNQDAVAGFQFSISGVNITSISGGTAEAADFNISYGSTGTIIGFSISGNSIPPGNATLAIVNFNYINTEVCINDLILSDLLANSLDSEIGECYCGLGLDCAGVCGGEYNFDCLGDCGGTAVVDCEGVCDGGGIQDCAGECNGDAILDCAGMCNGNAALDECGICEGQNSSCSGCTDVDAENYDDNALVDDGTCLYLGCTDPYADNYDLQATNDDGSCEYTVAPVYGTVLLENETNHSDINIEFFPISGSAQIDTVQTDDTGAYFAGLSPGMYVVNIFKEGYIPFTMPGEFAFFGNTQLDTYTMVQGIVQEISGTLDGNQRWTSAYQYRITDNVLVEPEDTLIIDPGVEILFMDDFEFNITGVLQANGTNQDSIRFTSGRALKNPGDWHAIKVRNNSYISHTIIEYANEALILYGGENTLMVDASTSRHNSGWGIIGDGGTIIINGCDIHDNGGGIAQFDTQLSDISNNQIYNNSGEGIYFYQFKSAEIEGNYLQNNKHSDIKFLTYNNWCSYMDNFIINENIFEDDSDNEFLSYTHFNIDINFNGNCDGPLPYENELYITNNQMTNNRGGGIYLNHISNVEFFIVENSIEVSEGYDGVNISRANFGNIERNFIRNAPGGVYDNGIDIDEAEMVTIKNNNIRDANWTSIRVIESPQVSIYNNIVWDTGDNFAAGVNIGIVGEAPYIGYNCFWNSNFNITDDFPVGFGEIITTNINGTPADTWYNIFQNPELTDIDVYGDENLTPIEGSVVIDAGKTDSFDPDGSISDIGMVYFDQGTAEPIITSISANQTYGTYPLFVQFSAEVDGPANTYNWNFGNGQTASGGHPVTSYTGAGTYSVSLTVDGPGGSDTYTATDLITVTEPTLPPEPGLIADITTGLVPLQVQFSNLTLNEADSYMWDFGDGNSSTQISPSHTYQIPGIYSVSLTANGPYGDGSVTIDGYINALEPEAIIASFNINESIGVAPFTVNFDNTTIGTVDNYLWDFGDGEISNDTNPSHTYNEYGAFTITLTATGPVNNDITNQSINVFLPSPIITDISDVPDDQGGRVYLTFVRSGHDTDSLNRFESYQVERLDDIGWVGVTNYNAYGTDIYNIEVPTMLDSTAESNAITSFRVISSMDEGLWESNIYDGYSVDNLAPSIPENLFVSSVNNDMYLGWDYIMDDDFSHHQVNQILGEPYSTVTNDITLEIDEGYNEFFLNSVDVHENISEQSEENVSAYNLHQGANLVSFSILPENNSIANVLNGIDVNAIIGEGVASTYNPNLGWLGSLLTIQPNEGYWLKSSNGEILNIIGSKYETSNYNLHYGANLISYNCAYPALITDIVPNEFISSIIGEGLAATYNPALGWVGSLYSLNPGQGYWVFSENSNADWSYDCSSLPIENLLHRSIVTTLNDYIQSTEQAFYFFKDIEGVDIGNVIRAYHGDAMIGSREWNGPYTDIPVMGKDFQQETRDYATLNSTIRFTIEKDGNGEINLDGEFPLWSNNGIFIIEGANIAPELPENYSINKIYPNPFNPSTTISYSLPEVSWVNISIYDIKGVKVDQLIDKNMDAGYHSIVWDSKNQASGVYIVQVSANGFRDNKKVMLMK